MPQNFLFPQRDQPLLLPVDMREWLPEDDLVYVVLDAVATLDLGEFRRRYRADGHGRAASGPEMMVALLLYGYCQGERSSRVIEKRCARDVAYRVIAGGLHPDHATIARFRARHEKALGGLFSQVLRLLAAEGMVSLGLLSLDGTKLAGNAAQKADKTLPQIEKILAEAAAADAAEDARYGDAPGEPAPRALARRAERRERLTRARDRLAAEDKGRPARSGSLAPVSAFQDPSALPSAQLCATGWTMHCHPAPGTRPHAGGWCDVWGLLLRNGDGSVHAEAEGVPRRVEKHPEGRTGLVLVLGRTEIEHSHLGGVEILDYHVEMHLLGRAYPGGSSAVGGFRRPLPRPRR